MKNTKKSSPEIQTPSPPQVMYPVRKPDAKKNPKSKTAKGTAISEKQLAPNEEL